MSDQQPKYVDDEGNRFYRRKWKTSDFYLKVGDKLEFRRNRDIVCYILDENHVSIEIQDDSDVWVRKTYSAAMKLADRRTRGDKGGRNTPNFQDLWLYNGESMEKRRVRILEEIANDKLSANG